MNMLRDFMLTDPAYWQDDTSAAVALDAAIDGLMGNDSLLLSAATEVQTAGELAGCTMTQVLVATALREALADAVRLVCSDNLDARLALRRILEKDALHALALATADEPA